MSYKRHTVHHIIPSSRSEEGFKTGISDNQILMPEYAHRGLHLQFHNATPQEQLAKWLSTNINVLSYAVRNAIFDLIELPVDKFYNNKFLK